MMSGLLLTAQLFLFAAVVTGKRVDLQRSLSSFSSRTAAGKYTHSGGVGINNTMGAGDSNSSDENYEYCMRVDSSDASLCKGGGWQYVGKGKCCTNKNVHCEEGASDNYCRGDKWRYFGKGKCCIASIKPLKIECEDAQENFMENCQRPRGKFIGNGKCCKRDFGYCMTLAGSDAEYCDRAKDGWQDDGDGKCCTMNNVLCQEDVDPKFCKGGGWKYFGKNKCCSSSKNEIKVTCRTGYPDEKACQKQKGKYLGNSKCCAPKHTDEFPTKPSAGSRASWNPMLLGPMLVLVLAEALC